VSARLSAAACTTPIDVIADNAKAERINPNLFDIDTVIASILAAAR
jgi:hypothetical protein